MYAAANSDDGFAVSLLEAMRKREKAIRTRAMLCAIYLDGRFPCEINQEELQIVKSSLVTLWEKICELNTTEVVEELEVSQSTPFDDSDEIFKQYQNSQQQPSLDQHETTITLTNSTEPNYSVTPNELLLSLEAFEKCEHPDHRLSFTEIWQKRKDTYPNLYVLASSISAIPPSQASVERCFSFLSLALTPRRYSMSPKLLEDILCINLNSSLIDIVFDKHRKELETEAEAK